MVSSSGNQRRYIAVVTSRHVGEGGGMGGWLGGRGYDQKVVLSIQDSLQ